MSKTESLSKTEAPPAAGPGTAIALATRRRVERVLADLRRADTVAVEDGGRLLLVGAAENGPPPGGESGWRLLVSARRAEALGLAAGAAACLSVGLPAGLDADTFAAAVEASPTPAAGLGWPAVPAPHGEESAEAAVLHLMHWARLLPAAVIRTVDTAPADLLRVSAAEIRAYDRWGGRGLVEVAAAKLPLADAEDTRIVAFRAQEGGLEHLAIVIGTPDAAGPVLVRVHSSCYTGDLLGSLRCDCGDQLRGGIREIAASGAGILLYLRQEGRGIGLINKLRAYKLQDQGVDTVDANTLLGFENDVRVYWPAVEMLRHLGISSIRLMTNNPDKVQQLRDAGIEVAERVPHRFPSNGHNELYLRTKAEKSGHLL
jgi:GTP cyclohydrolase II